MLLSECNYGRAEKKSSKSYVHAPHATKPSTRS
jgi:hypothetical protein